MNAAKKTSFYWNKALFLCPYVRPDLIVSLGSIVHRYFCCATTALLPPAVDCRHSSLRQLDTHGGSMPTIIMIFQLQRCVFINASIEVEKNGSFFRMSIDDSVALCFFLISIEVMSLSTEWLCFSLVYIHNLSIGSTVWWLPMSGAVIWINTMKVEVLTSLVVFCST